VNPLWILAAAAAVFALRPSALGSRSTPRGKGVFIRSLRHWTPDELAAFVRSLDLSWVAIQILWSEPGGDHRLHNDRIGEYTAALNAAGVDVWVWLYPSPDGVDQAVERTRFAYAAAPSVRGVIIDPEKPFYSHAHAPAGAALMAHLAQLGRPVGVTSYGMPRFHPGFPWEAFVKHAAFGVPQVYSDRGPSYAPEAVAEWSSLGFPAIVPALGASAKHSGAEMVRLASWVPRGMPAVVWWDLYHLARPGLTADARRAAVRSAAA
jgi:hypothetical protein